MDDQGCGSDPYPYGVPSENNLSFSPSTPSLSVMDSFPSDHDYEVPIIFDNSYFEDGAIGLDDPSSYEDVAIGLDDLMSPGNVFINGSENPDPKNNPNVNLDQNVEMNESTQGGLNAASNLIKGHWTTEEDRKLLGLVDKHGAGKWARIAKEMDGRSRRQCSARWNDHLRPGIKKDRWSEEEEKLFMEAHRILGNKWAEIAKRIPGRSENSIKNHFYITLRKQLTKQKKMNSSEPSTLQGYMKTNIMKEYDVHNSSNATTSSPSQITCSTSDDPSKNFDIQ